MHRVRRDAAADSATVVPTYAQRYFTHEVPAHQIPAVPMPSEVALAQLTDVKAAGVDKIHFAFAREDAKPGKPYTYRVQGPTFVIEFLNVQEDGAKNPANHIHSVWRDTKGDFGLTQ